MRFGRRFREVERKIDQPKQLVNLEEGYRKIHPETNITTEQCDEFWNKLFYSDDRSQEAIRRIAEETFNQK